MARIRISPRAQADLVQILSTSEARWGAAARRRYSASIAAAFRSIAAEPSSATSRDRAELSPGLRSLHLRHVCRDSRVGRPAHVVFYRAVEPDITEIVRVLHERMEPRRHVRGGRAEPA
ncbi:type II toxin-antitoxin system RelE/ParE family toxin [Rhodoplanes roseus]|uniref:Plasmid stabilization protein ParE n=1 Tax=Rhodoplanes roseus TaxID=29409 RepID=A0A327KS24_9BRAD|nr:type II toxin-antitoxin system RelE/ParE family toxin [Rhodoplanes roseus]RAI40503.1 hypothetical protein CH341_23675 [Rhodoplanes roseus]